MKNYCILLFMSLCIYSNVVTAQNTYCDSIEVDSVYIDNNALHLTVYNSSQLNIVYPFFTVHLNPNNDIQLNDSVTVLSFLSAVGDANNGYSTANYLGSIAPANTVPLNTTYSGTLTITDPNDSSFTCTYSFSFLYGTMPTAVTHSGITHVQLYPNPAQDIIYLRGEISLQQTYYEITDIRGILVLQGFTNNNQNISIKDLSSGLYFIKFKGAESGLQKLMINN